MISSLVSADAIYTAKNFPKVVVSMTLFSLYTIITLMETNLFIKDIGIGDSVISSGKLFYSLIAGYLSWFFKMGLSLLTLWVVLSAILTAVIGIINIFRSTKEAAQYEASYAKGVRGAMTLMAYSILSMYMIEGCIPMFAGFVPVVFLMLVFGFCILVYQYAPLKKLEDQGQEAKALRCLNTVHHHYMMFISLMISCVVVYMINTYLQRYVQLSSDRV